MRATQIARLALCASALVGGGALVSGCGGVPGNAVATVDGDSIPRADYTHWLGVFTKAAAQPPADGTTPPAKPTAAQLKQTTLQFLLSERWLNGEASKQGVNVTDAEVKKELEAQKKQSFPKAGDFQTFLKTSGQTEQDVFERFRVSLLSNKLSTKVAGKGGTVTDKAVTDFYAKNKAQFVKPEQRELRVVLTKDEAHAKQARNALDSGDSWKTVTAKYSIDDQTKAQAGKLPAQAKGSLDKDLDAAVFSAPKNELTGPLKTQYGYFVFTVTGVTPGSTQTVEQAKPTITKTLQSQNQQKTLDAFVKDFTARWRGKTQCSAGYRTSDCGNGPKPTPTPTAAAPQAAATPPSGQ
jgi:foldase protein PrsA